MPDHDHHHDDERADDQPAPDHDPDHDRETDPPRVSFPDELDDDDLVYEQPSSEAMPEPYSPPPEAIWGAP